MIGKIKNLFDKYISAGFPINYLKIETPQSAKADSSPKSGAKWLVFTCTCN